MHNQLKEYTVTQLVNAIESRETIIKEIQLQIDEMVSELETRQDKDRPVQLELF